MKKSISFHGLRPDTENGRCGILNPERGFRFEIGIGKTPDDLVKYTHVTDHWPFVRYTKDGVTMAQAYCYLSQYYNSPIPEEKLSELQKDFDRARNDGFKFVLRFAYEFDDLCNGPTREQIFAHMEQLRPLIAKNIDVIYVLQTGWVGLWGEFHTSIHGLEKDPETVAMIVQKTLDLLPPGRFTMMRRMQYRRAALKELNDLKPLTQETANTDSPHARIGFFNDGTLANYWDGGTFTDVPFFSSPGDTDFDQVTYEGYFFPVDGELFWADSPVAIPDGLRAMMRLSLHHYTTFSLVHSFSELDPAGKKWTIDFWKNYMLMPNDLIRDHLRFDPDYFYGKTSRSAFEYIRDHLGYRLAMTDAEFDDEAAAGTIYAGTITLRNYGFAAPINERYAEISLLAPNGKQLVLARDFDCRTLQPCAIGDPEGKVIDHVISFASKLPDDLAAGEYTLAVSFPDPMPSLHDDPRYAIRLATEIPVETRNGQLLHCIGPVTIR